MRRVNGLQVGNEIIRYGDNVYQTNGGFLLKFTDDPPLGMYPECSWDEYYDKVLPALCDVYSPAVIIERMTTNPIIIMSFKTPKVCCRRECSGVSSYRYCSLACWYHDTLNSSRISISKSTDIVEQLRHLKFMERLIEKYEELV